MILVQLKYEMNYGNLTVKRVNVNNTALVQCIYLAISP